MDSPSSANEKPVVCHPFCLTCLSKPAGTGSPAWRSPLFV